jgi:glycosyltransferase involved in cell wall biosynthesis
MSAPLVSICIPTRNRGASLAACLESIRQQDYEPLEMLISDNGSTDATQAIAEAAAGGDARIRYLRHERNIGLHANHNACLDMARGEFVCFFHDHDERDPRLISEYVAWLQAHPEAGVVCSNWELIDGHGLVVGVRDHDMPSVTEGVEFIDRTIRSGRCSVGIPGAMIRRAALADIRFDPDAPIGFGDFPVWFRLAERSAIGHIHRRLWRWRQVPDAQSARPIASWVRDYDENLARYCDGHLRRWPQRAALVGRWKRLIRRYAFWALAFEVGLQCRTQRAGASPASRPPQTTAELLGYRLSPEAFGRALDQLAAYRTAPVEYLVAAAMRLLIRMRLTSPLTWATYHTVAFRRLLRLC